MPKPKIKKHYQHTECADKIPHDTEERARERAANLRRTFGNEHRAVYQCRWCRKWHVGRSQ